MRIIRLIFSAVIELAPVIVAIVALPRYGFGGSILFLIAATVVSVALLFLLERRIPRFGLFGAISVVILGSLTVYTDDPNFIIILDSLGAFGFAGLLLIGKYGFDWLVLKYFFSPYFAITDRGWHTLTLRWSTLFILLGLGNEYVRLFRTPEEWVVWNGYAGLIAALFGTYQFTLSRKERLPEANKWGLRK